MRMRTSSRTANMGWKCRRRRRNKGRATGKKQRRRTIVVLLVARAGRAENYGKKRSRRVSRHDVPPPTTMIIMCLRLLSAFGSERLWQSQVVGWEGTTYFLSVSGGLVSVCRTSCVGSFPLTDEDRLKDVMSSFAFKKATMRATSTLPLIFCLCSSGGSSAFVPGSAAVPRLPIRVGRDASVESSQSALSAISSSRRSFLVATSASLLISSTSTGTIQPAAATLMDATQDEAKTFSPGTKLSVEEGKQRFSAARKDVPVGQLRHNL